MLDTIKYYLVNFRDALKIRKMNKSEIGKINKTAADLIRLTHSIEKGLSIENPRLGFGHSKQKTMIRLIEKIKDNEQLLCKEAVKMAIDSFKEYIDYHNKNNYSDEVIKELKDYVLKFNFDSENIIGGTVNVNRDDLNFDKKEIEKLFNSRHSIRDFNDSEIDYEKLKQALVLAQRAPSACNRQAVRAYVVGTKKELFVNNLAGIGGFADAAKDFIIITAKTSAYTSHERRQYIVSASMYAAYLSLTLHLYGFGACVVQRDVVWTKEWENLRTKLSIPDDEQAICLVAVGNLKNSFNVPLSHRLQNDDMIVFLDKK